MKKIEIIQKVEMRAKEVKATIFAKTKISTKGTLSIRLVNNPKAYFEEVASQHKGKNAEVEDSFLADSMAVAVKAANELQDMTGGKADMFSVSYDFNKKLPVFLAISIYI